MTKIRLSFCTDEESIQSILNVTHFFCCAASDDHIAELSSIVSRLATSDRISKRILNSAGSELGELACAVARKLKMTQDVFPVVATGGGFKSGRYLIRSFSGRIKEERPRAIISVLKTEPARGALMVGSCKLHERKYSHENKLLNLDRVLHRT